MTSITLHALTAFPEQLEAHYAAVPAAFTTWTPPSWDGMPSEHLSAIEQICHVRDIEIEGYQVRIGRILNEDNPALESLDSEELAVSRSYATADVTKAFADFHAARAKTLGLIAGLAAGQWERRAVFEGYGALTLRSLVHFLCSHDQQHLAGLQWLLGQIEASRQSD